MSTTAHAPHRIRRATARLVAAITLVAAVVGVATPAGPASAAPVTSGGFTTSVSVTPSSVARGTSTRLRVSVTAATTRNALVDVEVYDSAGRKIFQQYWDNRQLPARSPRTFDATWNVPASQATGSYRVDVGIFRVGWGQLYHWNYLASQLTVTAGSPPPATTTTTTRPPTTTTLPPTTTTRPPTTTTTTATTTTTTTTALPPTTTTTAPPSGQDVTLPPGSALPTDAQCAARVRPTAEVRPANATYNSRTGTQDASRQGVFARVTGNFTGTTDEILQWAACKWGFSVDTVRAQAVQESWWFQRTGGDFTTDPSRCAPGHPMGADGRPGQCAESVGLFQVRWPYHPAGFPGSDYSSAMNADYALAVRRTCFEGDVTWLNTVERGRTYAAGDEWGCIGMWFSGRWYTQPAVDYIGWVRDHLNRRTWTTPDFLAAR